MKKNSNYKPKTPKPPTISLEQQLVSTMQLLNDLKNIPAIRRGNHYEWQIKAAELEIGRILNEKFKNDTKNNV